MAQSSRREQPYILHAQSPYLLLDSRVCMHDYRSATYLHNHCYLQRRSGAQFVSHSGGHCGAVVWVWTVAKPTNVLQNHSQQADRPLLRTCYALRPVRSQAQSQLM